MSSLRRFLRKAGSKATTIFPGAESGAQIDPSPGGEKPARAGGIFAILAPGLQTPNVNSKNTVPEENANPFKRSIWKLGRKPKIIALWRRIKRFFDRPPFRPLNAAELAEKQEREERRKLDKLLKEEAKILKYRLQDALARRGICHRKSKTGMSFFQSIFTPNIDYIKFDAINLTPDAFYLHVDSRRIPWGVKQEDLFDPNLLNDLSISAGMEITADVDFDLGVWYVAARSSGIRAIPRHVLISDMLKAWPASADSLSFPAGVGQNGQKFYRSLTNMYSILIGGTVGGGKSNMINVILTTLIRNNSPDYLKILMVDLKGGMELSYYEGIPHLITHVVNVKVDEEGNENEYEITRNGIIEKRSDVPEALRWIVNEGERRMQYIKKQGHRDIYEFNRLKRTHKMGHILLVIDEWADVSLNARLKRECNEMLANIAMRMRAVGIHVIACTQVPNKQAIEPRIKVVMPARMAFTCPDINGSMSILDNGKARGLNPEGRYIFKWRNEERELQAPYMPAEMVRSIVRGVITGEFEEIIDRHDVTEEELFRYAIETNRGALSARRLYDMFRDRGIARAEIEEILKNAEKESPILVDGIEYNIIPGAGPNPRRMEAVKPEMEEVIAND